ncbi:hypothetical protein TNIN_220181 [Trichonephila inaurata madagascariensis]|uniref:Uncharacterized protein n=1 Tax=Trichonephila inaurata madagascariensis TaxID=2747483 RepID=A0A8X6Y9T7_9ARAC|nr:hypothetical protein TNIN_220181 [Trichonephila inaurata madagascariensis]
MGLSAAASSCRICQAFGVELSMNVWQGIGFKISCREICPSVIKLEQDEYRLWMTKSCRRPMRKTVVKRVVNLPGNSTLPVKWLDFICTAYVRRTG